MGFEQGAALQKIELKCKKTNIQEAANSSSMDKAPHKTELKLKSRVKVPPAKELLQLRVKRPASVTSSALPTPVPPFMDVQSAPFNPAACDVFQFFPPPSRIHLQITTSAESTLINVQAQ